MRPIPSGTFVSPSFNLTIAHPMDYRSHTGTTTCYYDNQTLHIEQAVGADIQSFRIIGIHSRVTELGQLS